MKQASPLLSPLLTPNLVSRRSSNDIMACVGDEMVSAGLSSAFHTATTSITL